MVGAVLAPGDTETRMEHEGAQQSSFSGKKWGLSV